jgi:ATP-dependent DNA helicase DinG
MIAPSDAVGSDFAQRIRQIFSADGQLSHAKGFEYRAEQQTMAEEVARALAEERHLVIEAGHGVGKSLAYLIPAVIHARDAKMKAVVSTYTINLAGAARAQGNPDRAEAPRVRF